MELFSIVISIATLLNGLLAGIFFCWSNAITPGIGLLTDIEYLKSFQAMNKSILNAIFYIVFLGPAILPPISIILISENSPAYFYHILITTSIIYWIGVIVLTFSINIPLNNKLESLDLTTVTKSKATLFRNQFEPKWNKAHLFRTISSIVSFALLIILCLTINSNSFF